VGGGGLIQFPAFLILVPGVPIPTLMGTNKLVSFTGTITALFRYLKNVSVPKTVLFPGLISSLSFAFLGAWCVSYLNKDLIRPLVVCLLVLVAGYTFFKKNLGSVHSPRLSKTETIVAAFATGGIIGFYDRPGNRKLPDFYFYFSLRVQLCGFFSLGQTFELRNQSCRTRFFRFYRTDNIFPGYSRSHLQCSWQLGGRKYRIEKRKRICTRVVSGYGFRPHIENFLGLVFYRLIP
jgi:hypothetical protein